MRSIASIVLLVFVTTLLSACGFAGSAPVQPGHPPGFFVGVWHGLLAPWTLILRAFLPIKMYEVPNSGWLYDFGFLIGITGSMPIGWAAAIVALLVHTKVIPASA